MISPANIRTSSPDGASWLTQKERGTVWLMRLTTLAATMLGRPLTRLLVRIVALHYTLFDRSARDASRTWFMRLQGRKPSFSVRYAHLVRFAQVTLDRFFLLRGSIRHFEVKRTGNQYLQKLASNKQGAILLGAHLGSFEAMRASGQHESFPICIVGHFENAKMINETLGKLDPASRTQVIHIGTDPIALSMQLKQKIENGESLAILADRVGLNDKFVEVDFFGTKAPFPTGPFLLAAALKCPVFLVFGLYFEPNRYELFCEPFREQVTIARQTRKQSLEQLVQDFANRLEHYCRLAPDNWFNFYNFWDTPR